MDASSSDDDGGGDDDDDVGWAAKPKRPRGGGGGGGTPAPPPSGSALTPLEKQVLSLQRSHPGILLAVETGYKYLFFGKDASIAAPIMNTVAFVHRDRSTLQTSIPVQRLRVQLRRLVEAGHVVGVVAQAETAAQKARGANKSSKTFERTLTARYSRATLDAVMHLEGDSHGLLGTGDGGGGGGDDAAEGSSRAAGGCRDPLVLCLVEAAEAEAAGADTAAETAAAHEAASGDPDYSPTAPAPASRPSQAATTPSRSRRVSRFGLAAASPSSGSVLYHGWCDTPSRS